MIIKDPELLKRKRSATRCEWCGRPTPNGADPHHLLSRGAAGSDVEENLASLCRVCHTDVHNGKIKARQLWELVAKRPGEKRTADELESYVKLLRMVPK